MLFDVPKIIVKLESRKIGKITNLNVYIKNEQFKSIRETMEKYMSASSGDISH